MRKVKTLTKSHAEKAKLMKDWVPKLARTNFSLRLAWTSSGLRGTAQESRLSLTSPKLQYVYTYIFNSAHYGFRWVVPTVSQQMLSLLCRKAIFCSCQHLWTPMRKPAIQVTQILKPGEIFVVKLGIHASPCYRSSPGPHGHRMARTGLRISKWDPIN